MVQHVGCAYIAAMPYLVTVGKMSGKTFVPTSVCVAYDAYLLHFQTCAKKGLWLAMLS